MNLICENSWGASRSKDFDCLSNKTMLRAPIPMEQVFEAKKIIE